MEKKRHSKGNTIKCNVLIYKQCRQSLLTYFYQSTTQRNIPHTGDEVAYGIWMKNRIHYEFFRNAFTNNKMTFKSDLATSEQANQMNREKNDFMFQLYGEMSHFKYMYIVLGGLLMFIILFGVAYEIARRSIRWGNEIVEEEMKLTIESLRLR